MTSPAPVPIPIDSIVADESTQARAGGIDPAVVEEYAEVLADEPDEEKRMTIFPPVDVFKNGDSMILADGFSRVTAARRVGMSSILAVVRIGNRRDAILHAVQANATHGQRRTNADKRRAVEMVLKDRLWSRWSDREIAKQCRVSHTLVSKVRTELSGSGVQIGEERIVTRGDSTYTMDTAAIGRSTVAEKPQQDQPDADSEEGGSGRPARLRYVPNHEHCQVNADAEDHGDSREGDSTDDPSPAANSGLSDQIEEARRTCLIALCGGPHCLDQGPTSFCYSSPALLFPPYTSAGVL